MQLNETQPEPLTVLLQLNFCYQLQMALVPPVAHLSCYSSVATTFYPTFVNPIIRTRTRYFRHAYHPTRDILVPENCGSDYIGFFSSGYDLKYVTTGIRSGTDWIR
jgi:hypothetical protein